MKQQANIVDIRIKRFMAKKMTEYPELKKKYGPRVDEVQRGYLLEDVMSLFNRRVKVS